MVLIRQAGFANLRRKLQLLQMSTSFALTGTAYQQALGN